MPEDRVLFRRTETIGRDDFVRMVDEASEGLTESTRKKLLTVAETTDAVAVGWFHCDGVSCPARQARRHNQAFQTAFDRAMAVRFGRNPDDSAEWPDLPFAPFVVQVADA